LSLDVLTAPVGKQPRHPRLLRRWLFLREALADIGHLVRSCHERWDGRGYPDSLAETAIPIAARIVCACDAFSAMTTDRAYRSARSIDEALREMRANAGTQFDPAVVTALIHLIARTPGTVTEPIQRPQHPITNAA
jgi:HD-GYP domain-containing protein (c-di-GMP phosphodiesterase class II)